MFRKFLWATVAIIVIGGSFFLGHYTHDYVKFVLLTGTFVQPPSIIADNKTIGADTMGTSSPSTILTPAGSESTGPVKVTAITSSSITVQTGFKKIRTFALSADIPVSSFVVAGQKGKSLKDISVGDSVVVFWRTTDPAVASLIALSRDRSLVLSAEETVNSVTGKIAALSGSEVKIVPNDAAIDPVTITLDASTNIVTIVFQGEEGRSLAVGSLVTASGLTVENGKAKAKLIVLAKIAGK